ncbi:MAG: hypothetical protein ACP5VS_19050 [Desulfomonilaceae bacterium]
MSCSLADIAQIANPFISGISAIVAASMFVFALISWRHSNRPLVTAFVTPTEDFSTSLELLVKNSGNEPARDIRLSIGDEAQFKRALKAPVGDAKRSYVENCFRTIIPALENGQTVKANFGSLDDTWNKEDADGIFLEIVITYSDFNCKRKFVERQKIRLVRVRSFAEGVWLRSDHEI